MRTLLFLTTLCVASPVFAGGMKETLQFGGSLPYCTGQNQFAWEQTKYHVSNHLRITVPDFETVSVVETNSGTMDQFSLRSGILSRLNPLGCAEVGLELSYVEGVITGYGSAFGFSVSDSMTKGLPHRATLKFGFEVFSNEHVTAALDLAGSFGVSRGTLDAGHFRKIGGTFAYHPPNRNFGLAFHVERQQNRHSTQELSTLGDWEVDRYDLTYTKKVWQDPRKQVTLSLSASLEEGRGKREAWSLTVASRWKNGWAVKATFQEGHTSYNLGQASPFVGLGSKDHSAELGVSFSF